MSGPIPPELTCRKCGRSNPWVYFAPVAVESTGTCICMDCAAARGWLYKTGHLKPGVALYLRTARQSRRPADPLHHRGRGPPAGAATSRAHWPDGPDLQMDGGDGECFIGSVE